MDPVTLNLDGLQLTFAEVSFWDWISARRELRDANGNVDDFELGMAMNWRSAVAGGFKGSFKDFCERIPARHLKRVSKAAAPFIKASEDPEAPTPETPSPSSEPAAP